MTRSRLSFCQLQSLQALLRLESFRMDSGLCDCRLCHTLLASLASTSQALKSYFVYRGDVGSWVREAAVIALASILPLWWQHHSVQHAQQPGSRACPGEPDILGPMLLARAGRGLALPQQLLDLLHTFPQYRTLQLLKHLTGTLPPADSAFCITLY